MRDLPTTARLQAEDCRQAALDAGVDQGPSRRRTPALLKPGRSQTDENLADESFKIIQRRDVGYHYMIERDGLMMVRSRNWCTTDWYR